MSNMIFTLYPLACISALYALCPDPVRKTTSENECGTYDLGLHFFVLRVSCVRNNRNRNNLEIGQYPGMSFREEINLIPFYGGVSMSMILNVVMFLPLGFLLPLLWEEYQSLKKTAVTGLFFSLGIEFCQLFNRRVSDVEDLLANTLGAVLDGLSGKDFLTLCI